VDRWKRDQLVEAYHDAGLENVRHRFYAGGRHESLDQMNRDQVTRDFIRWLDSVVMHMATPSSISIAR
jgi:alpha-beta hydrolase superfamily lysophospholipase